MLDSDDEAGPLPVIGRMGKRMMFKRPSVSGINEEGDSAVDSLFSSTDFGKAKNFKVVVRIRPMTTPELGREEPGAVAIPDNHTVEVDLNTEAAEPSRRNGSRDRRRNSITSLANGRPSTSAGQKYYHYDRVYGPSEDQEVLYRSAVQAVVGSTLEGYNGSIIAYGQTGTGKTFTIEGEDADYRGIIPRACEQVFDHVRNASTPTVSFKIVVSFLQIYNEKVLDLLDTKVNDGAWRPEEDFTLDVREMPSGETYVAGLSEHIVTAPDEVLALLRRGSSARTTASTKMNRTSSRSHAVFTMIIQKSEEVSGGVSTTVGRLNLVDLAGSERVKSTGVTLGDGKRMDEAKSINASLSAFGKVVLALTTGVQHVPYRDSKLTRILQGSLGGNCKTTMIATIGPAASSAPESVSTLKFASRAKKVKNYAVINQDMSDKAMLSAYEKEIQRLQEELNRTRAETENRSDDDSSRKLPYDSDTEILEDKLRTAEGSLVRVKSELEEVRKEKEVLQRKIGIMETMLLELSQKRGLDSDGTGSDSADNAASMPIEDTPVFQSKLAEYEAKIKRQIIKKYETKVAQLKEERQRNKRERAALDAERTELEALRSEVSEVSRNTTGESFRNNTDDMEPEVSFQSQSFVEHQLSEEISLEGEEAVAVTEHTEEREEDLGYEVYVQALKHPQTGIPMHTARYNHKYYRNVFTGEDAAKWFGANLEGVDDVESAEAIGQKFVNWGTIIPITLAGIFQASFESLYHFDEPKRSPGKRSKSTGTIRSPRQSLGGISTGTVDSGADNESMGAVPYTYEDGSNRPTTAVSRQSVQLAATPPPNTDRPDRPRTAGIRRRLTKVFSVGKDGSVGSSSSLDTSMKPRPPSRASIRDLDPSFVDCGATLLHSAAGQGDRTAMKTFFQTFPVDSIDTYGRTPLMYACCTNRMKSVELLLRQGCDVTLQDSDGRTALLWAAYYGHHDILKMLLKSDRGLAAHVGPDGRSAIHWASKNPSTKCLELLLRYSPQNFVNLQDTELHTALHWCILCQHHEHALKLIRAGANPGLADSQQRNALHYAVANESQMCLQVLLQNLDNMDIVNYPDSKKRTPLHLAITKTGPIDTVLLLLSLPGINVDVLDFRMTTPLHWAAVCGRTDVCKALVARGATLDLRDANGMTPLHYADDKGHTETEMALQRLQQTRGSHVSYEDGL